MKFTSLLAIILLAAPAVAVADDLDDAFQNLKGAVEKKDAARVKKLAAEVHSLTSALISKPAPESSDEKDDWVSKVAYAKSTDLFSEYALCAVGLQSPAATLIDLISALEQQNPRSKYLDDAYGRYMVALNQTGAAAKIPAVAEKAVQNFPENEDLLLLLADNAVNRKQSDRALGYATRLTTVLSRHPKPEGIASADWERKRSASLGRGYWIAGSVYFEKGQWAACDRDLRSALPLIRGSEAMTGPALFYLGMANYQLGKMTMNKARVLEGAKFSEQSAAIPSAFADQARHNALVMNNEARTMR